jgi:Ca-activated chloride channel family protein
MSTRKSLINRSLTVLLGCVSAIVIVACSTMESPAPSAGSASAGTAGAARERTVVEEIVVTGSRRYDRVSRGEPQQRSALESLSSSVAIQQATPDSLAFTATVPGEELWIIATPSFSSDPEALADDHAPGSGAMLAKLIAGESGDVTPNVDVPLPLKHTAVHAEIVGYVSTVDVTQQFENPYDQKIEAVYLFPLPQKAAVSEFVMTIGERRIRGILREREEAEEIYRAARAQGYQASLLTQHRPNVFEQKVANIEPGHQIDVNIRYFHTLAYSDGWYSFVFPTVVGPRYNPPGSTDPLLALPRSSFQPVAGGAGVRYLRPEERSGHDISISIDLDAGVAIDDLESSHAISEIRPSESTARIELADRATIPNRDFILDFKVTGGRVKSNLLTFQEDESGEAYFTMMLYPPDDLATLDRRAMEMIFVLDCSGSMSGAPIEQAKAAILSALDMLEPTDTFQVIRFSAGASQLGPAPVLATAENIARAKAYVVALQGGGGTQMIEGVRAALKFQHDPQRLRFVTFLTDGFIGNEVEILAEIHRLLGESRIFSFGVGSSVNRYLLERMAGAGRGAVAYLGLADSGGDIMRYFFDRISHPALSDLAIDWGGMYVTDVYPSALPDLFVGRPVVVTGKFTGEPSVATISGRAGGGSLEYEIAHHPNENHAFLPKLWARLRIADLVDRQAWANDPYGELGRAIRDTALEHGLVSDYTAFVAVDASRRTAGDSGTTVYQAVPVPDGVSYSTTVPE